MADLLVLNGSRAGAVFALADVPTVLGRSMEAHLRVDDPWISNLHAMFEWRGGDLWVVDLESRNGTWLGDERIAEVLVQPGLLLRFGRTEVRVEAGAVKGVAADPADARAHSDLARSTLRTDAVRAAPLEAQDGDPFALAERRLVVLRLALAVAPGAAPPDAAALRSGLDAAAHAIRAQGARTVRLAGAGVLAVFGLGGLAADDVRRAVRGARDAREDVRALVSSLEVRAALDVGKVIAGNVGGPEGFELAALGEAVDRCERALAAAGPGELLAAEGVPGDADPAFTPAPAPAPDALRRLRLG